MDLVNCGGYGCVVVAPALQLDERGLEVMPSRLVKVSSRCQSILDRERMTRTNLRQVIYIYIKATLGLNPTEGKNRRDRTDQIPEEAFRPKHLLLLGAFSTKCFC